AAGGAMSRPTHRYQDEEAGRGGADARPPQPQRTAQQGRAANRRQRRHLGVGDRDAGHLAHSRVLSFGVTRMVATSASKLTITYTAANSMASAWITGKSWLTTDSAVALPMPP